MHTARLLSVLFVCAASQSACGKWPPYKDDIVENFHEKRTAIETLEAAYSETEYWDVTFGPGETAETRIETEHGLTYQKLEDETDWVTLLRSANVYRVRKTDNGVEFELLIPGKKDRWFSSHYIHEPGNKSEFNECEDEYADIPCGACSVSLDDGWWFQTRWSPGQILSDDEMEQVGTGELSFEESSALSERALRACYLEGYRRLGYPVPEE